MPIDYIILAGLVFVFSFLTFYFGKDKAISSILSLYIGILFYEKTPVLQKIILEGKSPIFHSLNQWVVYLAVSIVIYLLISKHIHSFDTETSIFRSIIFGISLSILILSVSYFIIPSENIYNFGSIIDHLFIKNIGFYPYLLAPLVILLFI